LTNATFKITSATGTIYNGFFGGTYVDSATKQQTLT